MRHASSGFVAKSLAVSTKAPTGSRPERDSQGRAGTCAGGIGETWDITSSLPLFSGIIGPRTEGAASRRAAPPRGEVDHLGLEEPLESAQRVHLVEGRDADHLRDAPPA